MKSVKEKYLLTKESYRPLVLEWLKYNKSEDNGYESYQTMINIVANSLYRNFTEKFMEDYFSKHPNVNFTEFSNLLDNDKKLE